MVILLIATLIATLVVLRIIAPLVDGLWPEQFKGNLGFVLTAFAILAVANIILGVLKQVVVIK